MKTTKKSSRISNPEPITKGRYLERADILAISLLIILTLIVFWQVISFDFVDYDDDVYIINNPHIQQGLTVQNTVWAFTTFRMANWNPVLWLSFFTDYELFGKGPQGFHISNLFFHLAAVVLLYWILRRMTGSVWRSAIVAALFSVHPLHVESVAWVTERKDTLSACFFMLTIWAYMGYVRKPRWSSYALVIAAFVFGLMTKPMLVTLPLVLLLLDIWPLERFDWQNVIPSVKRLSLEKAPLLALSVVSSVVTYFAQKAGGTISTVESISVGSRLQNFFMGYAHYLIKFVFPARLTVLYPYTHDWPIWEVAAAAVCLVLVTVFALRSIRTRSYIAMGWLWYLITLLPVIGLVKFGTEATPDRFSYIPLIGIFIVIVWGIAGKSEVNSPLMRRQVVSVIAAVAICLCAALSFRQAQYWRNSYALFSRSVEINPEFSAARYQYANALDNHGRGEEALAQYAIAVQLQPPSPEANNNYGLALAARGRVDEAIKQFEIALKLRPNYGQAHTNLGVVLLGQNKLDQAEYHLIQAIKPDSDTLEGDRAAACQNLAVVFYCNGKYADAWKQVHECQKNGGSPPPDFLQALSEKLAEPPK